MRGAPVVLSVMVILALAACGERGASEAEPDAPVATVDAGSDAPPAYVGYDLAYIDELTIDPSAANLDGILGFLLVVNTGTAPLDLSTASVVSFGDDSDDVEWSLGKYSDSTTLLEPGHASGCLSQLSVAALITSGIVTEPGGGCADFDQGLDFEMRFSKPPVAGVTYHAQAVFEIAGVDIVVPFIVHGAETGETSGVLFDSTRRISTRP